MILDKFDQVLPMQVWNPRWHDKTVLLAAYKVDKSKTDHIKVTFPKSNAMKGDWYISVKAVRKFPLESNGTIQCYVVPLKELEPLEIRIRSIHV